MIGSGNAKRRQHGSSLLNALGRVTDLPIGRLIRRFCLDRDHGSTHPAEELAQLITDRIDLVFVEHDSFYRGFYLSADIPTGRIEIQPNLVPGDDGHDDPFDEDYPTTPTLLLITAEEPDTTIETCLNSIESLHQLTKEAL